jgi:hypothetical protein
MRLKPMQSDAPNAKPKIPYDDPANEMPKPANRSGGCKLSSDEPAQRISRKSDLRDIGDWKTTDRRYSVTMETTRL